MMFEIPDRLTVLLFCMQFFITKCPKLKHDAQVHIFNLKN